jgi:hypothetical protein
MTMDEKFWPGHKVCNYIFNVMTMSCLLQLIVLWHLSKVTMCFLVACVHYNYKGVANSIVDFQMSSSVWNIENVIILHEKGVSNVSSHSF